MILIGGDIVRVTGDKKLYVVKTVGHDWAIVRLIQNTIGKHRLVSHDQLTILGKTDLFRVDFEGLKVTL